MKRVIAHLLTPAGTPICKIGIFCEKHHVTCGQRSLAEARRVKVELSRAGIAVIVARGSCPESGGVR